MNKKKVILLIFVVLLVVFGVYITVLYFNGNTEGASNNNIVDNIEETYTIDNLPKDSEYDDNKLLYGGWESKKLEIYRDNKLEVTVDDNSKVIQVYNDDKMEVCYIENDAELICSTSNYSFSENTLYVISNDLYLSGKRSVIFKNNFLILISYLNNDTKDYSMLYFTKT